MSPITPVKTPAYSIISISDDEGSLSSPDCELNLEKSLLRTKPPVWRWNRILRKVGPYLWFSLAAIFIFAFGFHLGGSLAVYNLENGIRDPSLNLSDSPLSTNSTDNVSEDEDTSTSSFFEEEEERALITYVYFETPNARQNALFFINHGLHAQADFIFILNGETDLATHIPGAPNIEIIQRNNTCYDLGSHAEILTANNNTLINKYNRFIMLNASVRGPFLPIWSRECWSDAYLDKITETNKVCIYAPHIKLSKRLCPTFRRVPIKPECKKAATSLLSRVARPGQECSILSLY
ncbi:hypothetical protein TWF281_008228 [Arthrobotrys megalospora]